MDILYLVERTWRIKSVPPPLARVVQDEAHAQAVDDSAEYGDEKKVSGDGDDRQLVDQDRHGQEARAQDRIVNFSPTMR